MQHKAKRESLVKKRARYGGGFGARAGGGVASRKGHPESSCRIPQSVPQTNINVLDSSENLSMIIYWSRILELKFIMESSKFSMGLQI